MLNRLLGTDSRAHALKEGLNASTERVRGIAHRVSNAGGEVGSFGAALERATGTAPGVDLEREMVALADEQLRFEAMTRLLQKTYAGLRSAVRER